MFLLVETKFKINLYLEQRPCRFLLHPELVIVIHFFRPRRKYDVNDNDCEDDDGEWAVAGEEEEEEGHTGRRPLLGRPRILAF